MARYGMIIDIDRCNGCYNCFLACKDEYEGNDYPPISLAQAPSAKPFMQVTERERGSWPRVKVEYIPLPCLHCEEALCVRKASDGEVYRRPDGIVLIDPEKSKGKKEIVSNCPYRVISWNEEKDIPQKCTFCAHLLDQGWKAPRCVEACPSGALIFGDLDDPNSEISRKIGSGNTEEFHPEYGLKPSVHYMNLPKRFIAGEVVLKDQQDQCAEGVTIVLKDKGGEQTCRTNFLGDFEFEGLESDRTYTIVVEHAGYKKRKVSIKPGRDVNLGEIVLKPAG